MCVGVGCVDMDVVVVDTDDMGLVCAGGVSNVCRVA